MNFIIKISNYVLEAFVSCIILFLAVIFLFREADALSSQLAYQNKTENIHQNSGQKDLFQVEKHDSLDKKFSAAFFQSKFKKSFPRIVCKQGAAVEKIRQRYLEDTEFQKLTDQYATGASAWFCSKDYHEGVNAIDNLLKTRLTRPGDRGNLSNVLSLALQYDLLYDHPYWSVGMRQEIQKKLKNYVSQALKVLNKKSASLWHGRFQLACSTWVAASVFDIRNSTDLDLMSESHAHFLSSLEAIRVTEGWPEGYNYWINNRAYGFVLACLSHLNSVQSESINKEISKTLETTGLWTLYGTRPDSTFVQFGDTGPRNDLKDETQRFIDLVFLGTGNPLFKAYSDYLESNEKRYYQGYRWSKPVFKGLIDSGFTRSDKTDLSFLNGELPNSRIFGPQTFDQVFIRSGWGKDDTFISFRAGDTFTHHGHYQAGHFSIFKFDPLAIKSGTYGGYTSPHRLNYYIRSISGNTILIQEPDETIKPNRFFKTKVSAGGQRIIIPTGSSIRSVKNWEKNKKLYQGASITAFDNSDPDYVYINSDLTRSYSSRKARKVIRQMLYLSSPDALIVYDQVESTKSEYTKKWLLHTRNKPWTQNERVLIGEPLNGILISEDKTIRVAEKQGQLDMEIILPENPEILKIGGPDFKYYVETDGDDTVFDGKNMIKGANEKSWFDSGLWRIELKSNKRSRKNEFFVLLKPNLLNSDFLMEHTPLRLPDFSGIIFNEFIILFSKNKMMGPFSLDLHVANIKKIMIFGLPPNENAVVSFDKSTVRSQINPHGVFKFTTSEPLKTGIRFELKI